MIEARFGLKRRPFDKSIPTRDLYPWPGLDELAARLEMVKLSRGILLLTGEPGTGKTVALSLESQLSYHLQYYCW